MMTQQHQPQEQKQQQQQQQQQQEQHNSPQSSYSSSVLLLERQEQPYRQRRGQTHQKKSSRIVLFILSAFSLALFHHSCQDLLLGVVVEAFTIPTTTTSLTLRHRQSQAEEEFLLGFGSSGVGVSHCHRTSTTCLHFFLRQTAPVDRAAVEQEEENNNGEVNGKSNGVNGAAAAATKFATTTQSQYDLTLFNGKQINGNNKINGNSNDADELIPFVIERLSEQPSDQLFTEISEMCIQAFFNDDAVDAFGKTVLLTPPWKELQLAYLRKLQQGDLRRRRKRQSDTNFMLVARRVIPYAAQSNAALQAAKTAPLILDASRIYNLPTATAAAAAVASYNNNNGDDDTDFVRAEILGFVEVTQKPYGLGSENIGLPNDEESKLQFRKLPFNNRRPVLTNLSVQKPARKSGVGGKLLAASERIVRQEFASNEIILEVEEDNETALKFYQKRGYEVLFEDPTSRRYDLKGLWLRQVRCKRFVMRKVLTKPPPAENSGAAVVKSSFDMFQRWRDSVFSSNPFSTTPSTSSSSPTTARR